MAKRKKGGHHDPICDPEKYTLPNTMGFDPETVSREELLAWHKIWEPRGSGNLIAGRLGCTILHLVVKLRGFEPFTQDEIENYSYQEGRALLQSLGHLK